MTIGIIVYSQTGNTFSVAQKLALRLSDAGHTASIIAVETAGEVPPAQRPTLKEIPDVSGYDAVVFGSPVHAFSLSPAMTVCMEQIASLSGKRTGLFVTQQLPFAWMGGNRA
ncbi:MAG: flavodoxin family protein, partial [Acetanaerobacterium sp.]